MSYRPVVIRVKNLSKRYEIYDRPSDRLKQFIFPRISKFFGKSAKTYFREFWALKNVTFEVGKGETVGIVGRNGSGKSTLLQLICGTLSPTFGEIEVNGRVAALLELGSGFNPEFSGRENVFLNATILGLSANEISARFDAIADFADIGEFIEQPVKTYSSGMLVRLAFAVIAHVDADILVIDEALAVGDVFFTQKCMRFLRKFMETGTVLFVSHDTGSITALCNWALRLEGGALLEGGPPKMICENYLEDFYSSRGIRDQKTESIEIKKNQTYKKINVVAPANPLNFENLHSDINFFEFNEDAHSFGMGGVKILEVKMLNEYGQHQTLINSGGLVVLSILFKAIVALNNPIVGFFVRDKLGQNLFGDNTFIASSNEKIICSSDDMLEAQFHFQMPRLLAGDYSITVAVAEGTPESHIQHQWIHDALIFKSTGSLSTGIIGIHMSEIKLIKMEQSHA
jgi:lipopolysaccharide transport system ATP-binding protein